ncbi:Homeobox domain [Macleaya cordata]|uniref:Homeobox domain n=1 Tax=Macleaya cordata TaxID=56857 RepID=A0A200QJZ6_MACCD|nr:Homeobox domain [Macleaya cordata]
MGNDAVVSTEQDYGTKRKKKTHFQLESLENFYSEEPFPKQDAMEEYASVLNLTYKQVRGWFVERRRKDKKSGKGVPLPCKKYVKGSCRSGRCPANKKTKRDSLSKKPTTNLSSKHNRLQLLGSDKFRKDGGRLQHLNTQHVEVKDRMASAKKLNNLMVGNKNCKQKKRKLTFDQEILPPDYILKKIFRKDGPPLGVEFDSLPLGAFPYSSATDPKGYRPTCAVNQRAPKRRKVSKPFILQSEACQKKSGPMMKHGMGKGLMTVWRAVNPNTVEFPTGVSNTGREATDTRLNSKLLKSQEPSRQKMKRSVHQRLAEKRRLGSKLQDRRKRPIRKTEMGSKHENSKNSHQVECKLAIGESRYEEYSNALATLGDDEELELRELQAGPNPLTCSANLASNGIHSCSLCKDLLPRFPPHFVKMKQPFQVQPWVTSTELVKKLFKAFRFLYTHAVKVDVSPFTLDEFAQAFHDKDSLLLGKIHVALLKLLISDVEMELSSGFLSHASKDCRFLGFLHSVKHQEFIVKFWNTSLNPLTWTDILRQVLIAAGFGSRQTASRKELLKEEGNHMVKYGLRPGTLKGELFSILSEQGNSGLKVSELAKALQIVDLNLAKTSDELEVQICSTLSSDITLFEKIAPSAYRARNNPLIGKDVGGFQSDSEDSRSVDHDSGDSITNNSSDDSDDSELDSATSSLSIVKFKGHMKRKNNMLIECTEIDESHPGEVWVLGLMEGEYSDLSIEEKLNALDALVDLASAGSSLRMEDPQRIITERLPSIQHQGGAKIKRSSANQQNLQNPFQGHISSVHGIKEMHASLGHSPVDPSATISKPSRKENPSGKGNGFCRKDGYKTKGTEAIGEMGLNGHPLQSIYLGSDRRYNGYWLFLGPCNAKDPGHRRIYFESSEDGHWEVIDTEEALCALLSVLDNRGTREARLLASLEKREAFLCQSMSTRMEDDSDIIQSTLCDQSGLDNISGEGSSPISDIDNNQSLTENDSPSSSHAILLQHVKKKEDQKQRWDRLQAFDAWIWNSFYSNLNAVRHSKRSYLDSLARCESCHDLYWRDEKHCKICHITFELDFDLEERYAIHVATCREKESNIFPKHKVLPSQLQSLKAAIHAIEAVMPHGALLSSWRVSTHKLWIKRLRRTSSIPEFLQVLTDFIGAVNEDWLYQCSAELGSNTALDEIIVSFPTIPQTTSAVALWLVKLDTLLAPYLERVHSEKAQEKNTRQKGMSLSFHHYLCSSVCRNNYAA